MKNQNIVFIAIAFALAFALAPVSQAVPCPQGGCGQQLPAISIHGTGNVVRGNTGSFVLSMNSPNLLAGMYVNFTVGGTAIPGVDYVALVSPAFIGQSGYGTILVKTLPDPRGPADCQAYSVVVKLEPGAGYSIGDPASATIWIEPAGCGLPK